VGDRFLDTALEGGDGRYRAHLSPDWAIRGPNGGYLAVIAVRAAGREALWVPVQDLHRTERHVDFRFPRLPEDMPSFPGIVVGHPERQVVWGLTYRFLEIFFEAIGGPLADRWDASLRKETSSP